MTNQLNNYLLTYIEKIDQNLVPNLNQITAFLKTNPETVNNSTFINNLFQSVTDLASWKLSILLFLPDLLLYSGMLTLVIQLGIFFNTTKTTQLLNMLSQTSKFFIGWATIVTLVQWLAIYISFKNGLFAEQFDWSKGIIIFAGTYKFNFFTQTVKIILSVTMLILYTFINSIISTRELANAAELPLLLHISLCLAFNIASSNNWVLLLLALEGFSLILYILTTLDRTQGGITAAVKYFTFGTLGSILLFWGVVHLYTITPLLSYDVTVFLSDAMNNNQFENLYAAVSFSFAATMMLAGLLLKLGAAPLHVWVADVYTGVHTFITAVFATITKFLIFIIFAYTSYHLTSGELVDFMALCSLLVGNIITLRQIEIKRFLAYSSITHVGFLLIADFSASFIYIITYILSSLAFFTVLLTVQSYGKELIYLSDLRLIKRSGNWNSAVLVVSLASMAGLPPFAGFYGKFLIWTSLIEDVYLYNDYASYFFLVVSISLSLVTIFYYMRLLAYIYVGNDEETTLGVESTSKINSTSALQLQGLLVFILIFWTFVQSYIIDISLLVGLSLSQI